MVRPGAMLRYSWAAVALLFALLAALAILQLRWLDAVSAAERERMRAALETTAERFADDFDRELTRAFVHFLPPEVAPEEAGGDLERLAPVYAELLARWQATAPYPELIEDLLFLQHARDGEPRLLRLDPAAQAFEPAAWPSELLPLRERFAPFHHRVVRSPSGGGGELVMGFRRPEAGANPERALAWRREGGPPEGEAPATDGPLPFAPDVPAFLIPAVEVFGVEAARATRELRGGPPGPLGMSLAGMVVVRLDGAYLRGELLPLLAARHLAPGGRLAYEAVVRAEGGSGEVLYRSRPDLRVEGFTRGDVEVDLLGLLPRDEMRRLWLAGRPFHAAGVARAGRSPRVGGALREAGAPRGAFNLLVPWRGGDGAGRGWKLLLRHPAGSLEAAVAQARRGNLLVSFGVLLLLGLASVTLLLGSQRARRLAQQQVEFVAAVSHELRTPLAAVGSLGQNLADGLVREPEQVRRYGELLQREARRLGRLVEQVLELGGILAGRPAYARQRVDPRAVVEAALADCRSLAQEREARLEADLAAELPVVAGDPEALRRAVANLVGNALKHGGDRPQVGVAARLHGGAGRGGRRLRIEVADRGPGIPSEDLAHLFEPFYRGRAAREGQVAGSGLGLALVRRVAEAHGGSVGVHPRAGGGTVFTLSLPTLEAAADGEAHPPG